MAEPSPRPWKWECDNIETVEHVGAPTYGDVMACEVKCGAYCYGGSAYLTMTEADREFLIRAVNAHDDLLAACQFALTESLAYVGEEEDDDSPNGEIIRRLRAAISRATGGTDG